jgi:hypothetical protein
MNLFRGIQHHVLLENPIFVPVSMAFEPSFIVRRLGKLLMYFRYDTSTGRCTYLHVDTKSPGMNTDYKSFANIGYKPNNNGLGISDVSKWKEDTTCQVRGNENGDNVPGILTKRTYRYWDVAMQGDGTFLAIVCLW